MKTAKTIVDYLLHAFAFILAMVSIVSLTQNSELRFIKMFSFPRIQFFIVAVIILILMVLIIKKWQLHNKILFFALCCGLIINASFLINYTTLVSVDVPNAKISASNNDRISILLSNVEMSNRNSKKIIEIIKDKRPDIFLAMETDQWWDVQFTFLQKEYPYSQKTINDQTYGMILYSKFPMDKVEVDYLNNENVPSFQTTLHLKNNKTINFHSVHPVPPTYFDDLPDNEGKKARALERLGEEIKDAQQPILIAGDLNDVVWSKVDGITKTKNILFDVRVGRGFYNSFNAKNILMRWPLDHIFVSKEFQLKKLERLEEIGSDHFPIYAELILPNTDH